MEERRSRTILLRVFQHFLTILTLSTTPSAWPINLGQVILNTYPTSTTPSLILGSPSGESARRTGAASGLQAMFPITHSFSDKRDQYLVYYFNSKSRIGKCPTAQTPCGVIKLTPLPPMNLSNHTGSPATFLLTLKWFDPCPKYSL